MKFRYWCIEKWYDHCEEVRAWSGQTVKYQSAEYFKMYKWWLKRQYRYEVQNAV